MIDSYYLVLKAKKNLISNQIFNVGFENQKVIDGIMKEASKLSTSKPVIE